MQILYRATAVVAFLSTAVFGHMEMMQPYAIRSKYNPANKNGGQIDYSMTSPLDSSGSNFPCKGYQTDPVQVVATYAAGSKQTLKLGGSASHAGGSCQISLSYDGGSTFSVIKSIIGGCPLSDSYDFNVPSYAPSGTALLSWTWQNKVGNREYYMNCAWISIQSNSNATNSRRSNPGKLRRNTFNKFSDLPFVWKANMPMVNKCTTQEGEEPVYPHPGPDVQYGGSDSASSVPSSGECDLPSPAGPAYKSLAAISATPQPTTSSALAASTQALLASAPVIPGFVSSTMPFKSTLSLGTAPQAPSSISMDLESTSSATGLASYATAATTQINSAVSTPVAPTSTAKAPANTQPAGNSTTLPFADKASINTSKFLPCSPGSFLCTSAMSFAMCVDGNSYAFMGPVAGGMTCRPTSASGSGSGGSSGTLATGGGSLGTYRDDQYVAGSAPA